MGGCSSDFYKTIKKEHGELFQKSIVGSESSAEFRQLVKAKQELYDKKVEEKRVFIHNEIKKKEEIMESHYESTKNDIAEKLPLSLADYEQMKKQQLSEILGLEEFKRQFSSIHNQTDNAINSQKESTNKELEQIVKEAEEEYKVDSEKMKIFNELPEEKREMIRLKGIKEFLEQISKRMTDLKLKYADLLDIDKQVHKLEKVVSISEVDNLVNLSKNKFFSESINIIGVETDSEIRV